MVRPSLIDAFSEAIDLLGSEREAYMQRICGNDLHFRNELESLLIAHESAGDFLSDAQHDELDRLNDPLINSRIGAFSIVERIGEGGMGAVYLAERADDDFDQRVAIKVIRRGIDSAGARQRFHEERRLLARLEHPNIARLIDGGETEAGGSYLAMEYVDGLRLDQYCDEHALDVRQRVQLFREVCDAVQYAHQKLIVHQDIKPGNVMVTAPESSGVRNNLHHAIRPKLLDFGIAKIVAEQHDADDDESTSEHLPRRLFTPAYASPEQIRGNHITAATDVYSLGVLLYELLAGRSPYPHVRDTSQNIEHIVCNDPPTRLSTAVTTTIDSESGEEKEPQDIARSRNCSSVDDLRKSLRGDLDAIIDKALEKDPAHRYNSVQQFSEDLRRYLDDQPVMARPMSKPYRLHKFLKRNALVSMLVAAAFVLLIGGLATSLGFFFQVSEAREEEKSQRMQAEATIQFLESLFESIDPKSARDNDTTLIRNVLHDAADRVKDEFGDLPEIAAKMHVTIGRSFNQIHEVDEARLHLNRAIDLYENLAEPMPEALAMAYLGLSVVESNAGQYDASLAFSERAQAILQEARLSESTTAIQSQLRIGHSLMLLGDNARVIPILRDALAMTDADDPEHQDVRRLIQQKLGRTLTIEQQFVEAQDVLNEAYGSALESYGLADGRTANIAIDLAWSYFRSNDGELAERYAQEALETYHLVKPPGHPDIATATNQLASALQLQKRFEDAEVIFFDALRLFEEANDGSHPDVGTALNNIGVLYREWGKHEQAIDYLTQAADMYAATLGDDHIYVGIVLENVVAVMQDDGTLNEATDVIDRALTLKSNRIDEDAPGCAYLIAARAFAAYENDNLDLQSAKEMLIQAKARAIGTQSGRDRIQRLLDAISTSQQSND